MIEKILLMRQQTQLTQYFSDKSEGILIINTETQKDQEADQGDWPTNEPFKNKIEFKNQAFCELTNLVMASDNHIWNTKVFKIPKAQKEASFANSTSCSEDSAI